MPDASSFAAALSAVAADIDARLERLLSPVAGEGEIARPARLLAAMRYAMLPGGKRLRPFLTVETSALFAVPRARSLMAAAAIECVHGYSLVHDDLPAMDDDALRRGLPSLHKAFDEATAILAGDALLTLAFDILARPETHPAPAVRIALVALLARAAGIGGMAGGQMLDLSAEGRFAERPEIGEAETVRLQTMKTAALIRAACRAGAILGEAEPSARAALERYGEAFGRAFQIADDLLDAEGETAALGKAAGKDAAAGKATLVGLIGAAEARARLAGLVEEAEAALSPFGAQADRLRAAARFVAARRA